jgi:ABC-type Na+ efflux pump permease subunit
MRKALVIARREYMAMVGSKAFLISLSVMPILMLGGAIVPNLLRDQVDVKTKKVVILDESAKLYEPLTEAVNMRNDTATLNAETGKQTAPRYEISRGPEGPVTDDVRFELSEQVRSGELNGFVEIPADVLQRPTDGSPTKISFYAENTALSDVKRWFEQALVGLVQTQRLQEAGIDPLVVNQSKSVRVEGRGLFERASDGGVTKADESPVMLAIFLPMGVMMFMFMVIMMSAQPMLESVLEEKTNRIAEVLLGSASPSQIMMGKLLGNVAASLTVVAIYAAGGFALATYKDVVDVVPLHLLPWFIVFQVLAVLMFSSIFLAIGSTVSQLKEAQSLLMPVWILIVTPMFVWFNVVREPNGGLATAMSFIPPFTPMLMCLRMAATSTVPMWQPIVGLLLMLITTSFAVFAAGRIFRIGMLSQGRAPKLTELAKWAISG